MTPVGTDAEPLEPSALPWSAIEGLQITRFDKVLDLVALPDGGLLLAVGNPRHSMLYRIRRAGDSWAAERVARDESMDWSPLQLSSDARTVQYASRADERQKPPQLHRYDVQTQQLHSHPIVLADGPPDGPRPRSWGLVDGDPALFFSHGINSTPREIDARSFAAWQATAAPAADGADWPHRLAFRAPRQGFVGREIQHLLMWPVRWRGAGSLWVEDHLGLAELNPVDGRVRRAIALPQRAGFRRPTDAAGIAPRRLRALGSVQGNWIAVGFDLLGVDAQGRHLLTPDGGARRSAGTVGLHVVDRADGRVRHSASLPGLQSDGLTATARSAQGRFLAMSSATQAAIWVVAAPQTTRRLAAPGG